MHHGKVHDYIGIDFDSSEKHVAKLSMIKNMETRSSRAFLRKFRSPVLPQC
jgi:hypothetical protein